MASVQTIANSLATASMFFAAPWGAAHTERSVGLCIDLYQRIKTLPPTAQWEPCAPAAGAPAVCNLEPQLWQCVGQAGSDDTAQLLAYFDQAVAGSYFAGLALQGELATCPAAQASPQLLFQLGAATALAFRCGLAAANRLAEALQRRGELAGEAADTLRRRLPFLLGLLVRPWALLSGPQALPQQAARWVHALLHTAWRPQALQEACMRGLQVSAILLQPSAADPPVSLASACVNLATGVTGDQCQPPGRRILSPLADGQRAVHRTVLVLAVAQLADAASQGEGTAVSVKAATVDDPMWQYAPEHLTARLHPQAASHQAMPCSWFSSRAIQLSDDHSQWS
ncbi:hypothetical protein ABPG75_007602 [Micractinium tetrahymenae]